MEREKKDLSFILILLSTLIGTAVLFQWAIVTGLYAPLRNPAMWERLMEKDALFRFLYVILIGGLAFLFPVGKVKDENKKWVYTSMTLVSASMLVIGFSRLSAWYNLFVFPTVFVAYTLLVIKTLPYFIRRHAQSDDSIFGLSREESAFYFSASSVSSVVNRKKSFFLCKIESEMLYLCIPWKNLSYIYWDAVPLCLLRDILRPLKS